MTTLALDGPLRIKRALASAFSPHTAPLANRSCQRADGGPLLWPELYGRRHMRGIGALTATGLYPRLPQPMQYQIQQRSAPGALQPESDPAQDQESYPAPLE